MGPVESATRKRLRRVVQPANPASVKLADAAVRLARLADGGDDRPMVRHHLGVTLSHLNGCDPVAGSWLDDLRARHCIKMADLLESGSAEK